MNPAFQRELAAAWRLYPELPRRKRKRAALLHVRWAQVVLALPDWSDIDDDDDYCIRCGAPEHWIECWACFGSNERGAYELDGVNCGPGDVEDCRECHGMGGWTECSRTADGCIAGAAIEPLPVCAACHDTGMVLVRVGYACKLPPPEGGRLSPARRPRLGRRREHWPVYSGPCE